MPDSELPLCATCGTQSGADKGNPPTNCIICEDGRQFVPGTGQAWTTLAETRKEHKNKWVQDTKDSRLWYVVTEPRFAIGQRAFLLQTPHGNVLWDLIALIDDETIDFINSKGGLKAIVISHPHYYTTHAVWSKAFSCPIYTSREDEIWHSRAPSEAHEYRFLEDYSKDGGLTTEIVPGVTAIKAGGHFDGSLLLHWENKLFLADTIVTVPSAHTPHPRPAGQTTYAFLWSIPNSIPLHPDEVHKVWRAVKPFSFTETHGAFETMDLFDKGIKERMLRSMQIVIGTGGADKAHPLFKETVD